MGIINGKLDPPDQYSKSGVGICSMGIINGKWAPPDQYSKSGVGICSMGVMRPDLIMRSIIPVVMAGVLGIYGLITAVIINGKLDPPDTYSQYSGYAHLGAGLTVGMSSLASGLAIGIVGDAGVRANAQQPRLFV